MNMDDREIENLLRRYRPVGPPADLRARLVPARRAWPWVAAAAALLAMTLGARIGSGSLASQVPAVPDTTTGAVAELTRLLGGDESARRMAEVMLVEQQMRRELARAQ